MITSGLFGITHIATKFGGRILASIGGIAYVSARLGMFGTNEVILKNMGTGCEGDSRRYISMGVHNMVLFHSYYYWLDDTDWHECTKTRGFSIRPTKIIHYDDKGIKTEHK